MILNNLIKLYLKNETSIKKLYGDNKQFEDLRDYLILEYYKLLYNCKNSEKQVVLKSLKYNYIEFILFLEINIFQVLTKSKNKNISSYFKYLKLFHNDINKNYKFKFFHLIKDFLKTLLNNQIINYFYLIQNKFVFIINGNNNTLINNYLKNKKILNFFLSEAFFIFIFK